MTQSQLRQRALSGAVGFLITLAFLIFLPAWSLTFWQGWIYWSIFAICVFIITLYFLKHDPKLMESRLNAGPTAEKEKSQKIIQSFLSVFFILLFLVSAIDHHFGWSHVSTDLVILSDALSALGFFIVFLTFKENSYTSAIIEVDKSQTVTSTGPYALVRHPMYAGATLLLLSTPYALGSLWGILCVIPIIVGIVWRLLEEEKFLIKNLKGYKEYRNKTKYRLIPLIW